MFGVIIAGGHGTRFWPVSRKKRPKQLLNIIGDQTMLQMTVDRLRKIRFIEDIYIVVGSDLSKTILKVKFSLIFQLFKLGSVDIKKHFNL